ncbi:MAG: nucleoside triphosphate pyrophosphohydrolase [Oscillospiraceae bacterium]|nr:nucleoside triphosphate pyrophosphohydrolase [Oscillospiraceae bacterium]
MVDFQYKDFYDVQDLIRVVSALRGPGGCPWDQEQTHASIRRDMLEEAYEVVEAIDQNDPDHLKEELGDVLLQVVFHTSLEQEQNGLTLDQVADGVCKKLIYRHPHVFGQVKVSGTGEVLSNWEKLKRVEKGQATNTDALEAVARSLPALWRAEKVQKKAEKAGYDHGDEAQCLERLTADTAQLQAGQLQADEIGQLLFDVVALCRRRGIDPEVALGETTDRFIARFAQQEQSS